MHELRRIVFLAALAAASSVLLACARQRTAPPHSARASVPAATAKGASQPKARTVAPRHDKAEPPRRNPDALAPQDVGYYMDVLEGRLKQLAIADMRVSRFGDRIVAAIAATFDAHAEPDAALRDTLRRIAAVLLEYRKTAVSVRARMASAGAAAPVTDAEHYALAARRVLETAGVPAPRAAAGASQNPTAPDAAAEAQVVIDVIIEPQRGAVAAH